jgi:hypothetical protein
MVAYCCRRIAAGLWCVWLLLLPGAVARIGMPLVAEQTVVVLVLITQY